MQALDLQQVQVAGDDDRRLDLAEQKEEQVAAEVQLRRAGVDEAVGAGVDLHQ